MASTPTFAIPHRDQRSPHLPRKIASRNRISPKRKRDGDTASHSPLRDDTDSEYTATVTPLERSQKRLAGLPLDAELPGAPFPHAPVAVEDASIDHTRSTPVSTRYLRKQNLAELTALLHRFMMTHDYTRASRVLDLILEHKVDGRPVDIRSEGLWGIKAEILLRIDSTRLNPSKQPHASTQYISREGFDRAKTFYETLIIRYPQHRTWPGVVNARDFCIAMFGLWIYWVHQESLQLQKNAGVEDDARSETLSELQVKLWELEESKKIAEDMDNRMQDVYLRDEHEMVRLRGMVALWIADLLELCSRLEEDEKERLGYDEEYEDMDASQNVERIRILPSQTASQVKTHDQEAAESRILGRKLLDSLTMR